MSGTYYREVYLIRDLVSFRTLWPISSATITKSGQPSRRRDTMSHSYIVQNQSRYQCLGGKLVCPSHFSFDHSNPTLSLLPNYLHSLTMIDPPHSDVTIGQRASVVIEERKLMVRVSRVARACVLAEEINRQTVLRRFTILGEKHCGALNPKFFFPKVRQQRISMEL